MPGARARAPKAARLAFGTIDSWLICKLTGGAVHATDVTNASRTMLLDLKTLAWDDELLTLFDVPRAMLPEVRDSAGDFGEHGSELFGARDSASWASRAISRRPRSARRVLRRAM